MIKPTTSPFAFYHHHEPGTLTSASELHPTCRSLWKVDFVLRAPGSPWRPQQGRTPVYTMSLFYYGKVKSVNVERTVQTNPQEPVTRLSDDRHHLTSSPPTFYILCLLIFAGGVLREISDTILFPP